MRSNARAYVAHFTTSHVTRMNASETETDAWVRERSKLTYSSYFTTSYVTHMNESETETDEENARCQMRRIRMNEMHTYECNENV